MITLFAIRPTGNSAAIHLYSPGYQPGKKARRPPEVPLCNGASSVRDHDLVPLAEALRWADPHAPCDHCGEHRPDWHWCRTCLAHAVDVAGLAADVVIQVAERQARP